MVTGWYDHCGTGPIDFYLETMKHATIMQKENTHLIIGPWDHTAAGDEAKEYDFGVEANLDHKSLAADFFDMHLKQKEDATLPSVKIFVMGRNVWRDETEWPLSRAKTQNLFLHSSGNVRGAWQRGSLSFESPAEEKPDSFEYDPSNPLPSWGGANSYPAKSLPMKRGPRDQRITLYRDDVLSYFSKPLEQPLEVTGPLKLILYAASSAVDTDFTAKLMDVSPDGDARLLTDGVVRARYRNGYEEASLLEPGLVYRYEIDLWNTSNEFQPGHRIGLAISSSNFPRIDRNLNTGGNYGTESNFFEAKQTIFHNAQYPSHLILPIIRN